MRIVVLDAREGCTEESWERFLDKHARDPENRNDARVLIMPKGNKCDCLERIWNGDVYCVENGREAMEIIAYLRGEGPADVTATTIYL